MAATIRDVAEKAGVSVSTVSKALNGSGYVSNTTADAVRKAAAALRYTPNERARSLAKKANRLILFVADFPFDAAFVNPHMFEIMRGAQHMLSKNQYSLVMEQMTAKEAPSRIEQMCESHQADGYVFHMSVITKKLAALITRREIPHIVIGRPNFDSRLCWIDTDNCLSGELAALHLLERGYRDIAFIGGRTDDMTCWRRLLGVRNALREHGIELGQERVISSNSLLSDGLRAVKKLLKPSPRPQAVICANNPIALGVLQALQASGVRVPEDMALITFDTYPFSLCCDPPLTVVDINMYDMGQEAGRLLIQKLKHPRTQVQSFCTAPELVVRGTT